MSNINELIKQIKSYNPQTNEKPLKEAFDFACLVHEGQKRLNGKPFIDHCLGVAFYLAMLRADDDTLIAALLHDVLEYSNLKAEDLTSDFGETVAWLVEMASGIRPLEDSAITQSENLRKMFLAMAKDIRVVLLRLAEKLDNLDIIESFPEDEGEKFCQRILDIYVPLAERLGVVIYKRLLEDGAFKYLYQKEFKEISQKLSVKQKAQTKYISRIRRKLLKLLAENGILNAEIFGRGKTVYSSYQKIKRYKESGKLIDDNIQSIYDQIGITVLVGEVADCYTVLGLLHNLWKHLPEEFDDYIASPKPNGYQALQTTLFALDNKMVEVQIKTYEMHEYNEFGPASHIYYKMFGSKQEVAEQKIGWVKELIKWQQSVNSPAEFAEGLKLDFFADRIFCFTPKGDVKDLPVGATPIDFGYAIHTNLGDVITGAKVNGRVVSLDSKLKNGDIVELMLSKDKNKKPSRDWLKFVVTTTARKKIKKAHVLD